MKWRVGRHTWQKELDDMQDIALVARAERDAGLALVRGVPGSPRRRHAGQALADAYMAAKEPDGSVLMVLARGVGWELRRVLDGPTND